MYSMFLKRVTSRDSRETTSTLAKHQIGKMVLYRTFQTLGFNLEQNVSLLFHTWKKFQASSFDWQK